jgi:hypothetical protein
MIFNKEKSDENAVLEFRRFCPKLANATDFEMLVPDIENAEYELRKIVGDAVFDKAQKMYEAMNVGEEDKPENLLAIRVQSAIANMAFRDYTVTNDLSHSATGRKAIVDAKNEKQSWEFFIDKDNEGLNYRIQKALNRLFDFLNKSGLTEWTSSKAYQLRNRVLLSSLDLFERFYPIDSSLSLFNMLLPFQYEQQRLQILPVMGKELYTQLVSTLQSSGSGSGADESDIAGLINFAGPALALWTMAIGIKRLSVKLLPEGLVQQFKSSVQARNSSMPVKPHEKDLIVSMLMNDAQTATTLLEAEIRRIQTPAQTAITPVSYMADRNIADNKYFSV